MLHPLTLPRISGQAARGANGRAGNDDQGNLGFKLRGPGTGFEIELKQSFIPEYRVAALLSGCSNAGCSFLDALQQLFP